MRRLIGTLAVAFVLVAWQAPAWGGDQDPVAAAEVERLVAQLESDDYRLREEATERLVEIGAPALDALERQQAERGSLEAAVRVVEILERIYAKGDDAVLDAAEPLLERMATGSDKSVARRAAAALEAHYEIRERRAVAQIRKLGGVVERRGELQGIAQIDPRGEDDMSLIYVLLGTEWKGGDEGLKYIKRLTRLPTLYRVKGAQVSDEAIAELHDALPQLTIQERGQAHLGISGLGTARGCQIRLIKPGSAADRAGLMVGDVVANFDEEPVEDFNELIRLIAEHAPGDKVNAVVVRRGEALKVAIVLGAWED